MVRLSLKLEAHGAVALHAVVDRGALLPRDDALGLPGVGAVGLGRLSEFEGVAAVLAPRARECFGGRSIVGAHSVCVALCGAGARLARRSSRCSAPRPPRLRITLRNVFC